MKIKLHVKYDFTRMNPLAKCSFGSRVVSQLRENAGAFGNLPFSPDELAEANNTLQDKVRLYNLHGKTRKGSLLAAKREWLRRFRVTATHIDARADGNPALIARSGFHLTKGESAPSKEPGRLDVITMQGEGQKGAVRSLVKPLRDARGYIMGLMTNNVKMRKIGNQITFEAGGELITIIVGSQREVKFTDLPRLTSMKGIAAAFNRAGLGEISGLADVSVP